MPRENSFETKKVAMFVRLLTRIKPSDESIQRIIAILRLHNASKSVRNYNQEMANH